VVVASSNRQNAILSALPVAEQNWLNALLEQFAMQRGQTLIAPDSTITHACFPLGGLVSLLAVTKDGDAIETGVVGFEGVVGGGVGTGAFRSVHQAVVQMESEALRIEAPAFAKAYAELPVFRGLVNSYQNFVLLQAQQNAACHALHDVESRLCRWLLQATDVTGEPTLALTQEFLSHMLGVRRSSVSIMAHKIQRGGMIRYTRGNITILDRDGLKECACECYGVLRSEMSATFVERSTIGTGQTVR
jgi:CRP-like cAMP-binding protein